MNKGVPAGSSVAERLVINANDDLAAASDWTIIVLKDALSIKPVPVKILSHEQFEVVSRSGSAYVIGYGEERTFLPSIVHECHLREGTDEGTFVHRCSLPSWAFVGAPILVDIDGSPSVIGIILTGYREGLRGVAVSAQQFENTIVKLMQSKKLAR
jgi:hypothetical protein